MGIAIDTVSQTPGLIQHQTLVRRGARLDTAFGQLQPSRLRMATPDRELWEKGLSPVSSQNQEEEQQMTV